MDQRSGPAVWNIAERRDWRIRAKVCPEWAGLFPARVRSFARALRWRLLVVRSCPLRDAPDHDQTSQAPSLDISQERATLCMAISFSFAVDLTPSCSAFSCRLAVFSRALPATLRSL
ncbi:hypothetical protein NUW54_g14446 [Trametes sanguinea]|uniref:Uncharacterized protein n=1 Tax=Trametes sanguinea TaxID=158606 RepID=A0ACC1MD79_9APHY|nr:hypothetical protein NUW54_g14446 [Trametes sanguinea]